MSMKSNHLSNRLKIFFVFLFTSTVYFNTSTFALVEADPLSDPLPSWNDGTNKRAILDFIESTTNKDRAGFVPLSERLATFDEDGTLWVEKPFYTELAFAIDRIKTLASEHPEWKTTEPFASILSGNQKTLNTLTMQDIQQIVALTHSGMAVDDFISAVRAWLSTAKHPRFDKPYTQLIYKPMLELMQYLQTKGYKTYIVTGGGQDFVRAFANQVYNLQPENVIGTTGETKYIVGKDGRPELIKLPKLLLLDDHAGKPVSINLRIGRRPYAAFGNSTGDKEMLEWTQAGGGQRLIMLVHHDDSSREYSYGGESNVGTFSDALMAEAKERGWCVISIKNDWKEIF
jgi:phosphoserine phosphatase